MLFKSLISFKKQDVLFYAVFALYVTLPAVAALLLVLFFTNMQWVLFAKLSLAAYGVALVLSYPIVMDINRIKAFISGMLEERSSSLPHFYCVKMGLKHLLKELEVSWKQQRYHNSLMDAESRVIFNMLPDILLVVDKDLLILRANDAAEEAFGNGSLTGKNLADIVKEARLVNHIKLSVASGAFDRMLEIMLPMLMDRYFRIQMRKLPLSAADDIAIAIIFRDISERKRTERMFTDFVANASHEIRTPLTSIVGSIETMQTIAKDDPKAQKEFLKIMDGQAQYMSSLLNDLLCLSKIEKHIDTLPTETVAIQDIVKDAKQQVGFLAKQREVNLVLHSKKVPKITGDTKELTQVFVNLLSNAVKYGKEEGEVEITIDIHDETPVDSDFLRHADKVVSIAVADQGEGIEEKHLSRLTERFYRVDPARSRKAGGTGLGLAIVKQIVRRHRGELVITSKKNVGSTFTLYLPYFKKKSN